MATIERHVTRDLVALDGDTSCAAAARRMAEQGIGSVAVRVDGRCIGIVTDTAPYPLAKANEALADLRAGRLQGAAVLVPKTSYRDS